MRPRAIQVIKNAMDKVVGKPIEQLKEGIFAFEKWRIPDGDSDSSDSSVDSEDEESNPHGVVMSRESDNKMYLYDSGRNTVRDLTIFEIAASIHDIELVYEFDIDVD
jgi:hypothetical protein